MDTCTLEANSVCRQEVFSEIFQKHFKALRNFLSYQFGNTEEVADTAQEAFATLWQNCSKVTFDTATGYVYKVAYNKSLKLKSHQKVVLAYEQQAVGKSENIESPEFLLEEKQFKEKLLTAIASLNEPQRVAFLMHRIDKMKYAEIASVLGISVKAVEKRISQALTTLKDEFKKEQAVKLI
ncbi:MAG: sigma-70 family RNA polymerase sigma factor [Flavitalea sp.]